MRQIAGTWGSHRLGAIGFVSALIASLAVVVAPTAQAATLTVTSTSDSGPGSLRDVLSGAQDGDTVTFASNVTGTITLQTDIEIDENVTITGPGATTLAISGGGETQSFTIATSQVTMTGLTIEDGAAEYGAGLYVGAGDTATLSSDTFSDNVASDSGAAIQNDGTVQLGNDLFTGNQANDGTGSGFGGAIYNSGTVGQIDGSTLTFTDNSAGTQGGAIDNEEGTVYLGPATFTGNQAIGSGGAISQADQATGVIGESTFSDNSTGAAGNGGAVVNLSGSTAGLSRDTFDGNTAGSGKGGAVADTDDASQLYIANDTLFDNTGSDGSAVYAGATGTDDSDGITAEFLTLAGDPGSTPVVEADSGGQISIDYSIIEAAGQGCAGTGTFSSETKNVGDGATCGVDTKVATDAQIGLGALADNGGPTETMAIAVGSAALDRAPHSVCSIFRFDQRGDPRGSENCDAGAFEHPGARYTITVTKSGTGSGYVTGQGIDCGNVCTAGLNTSPEVLTAHPAVESTFVGWGTSCSGTGSCTVQFGSGRTSAVVKAVFRKVSAPKVKITKLHKKGRKVTIHFSGTGGQGALTFRCRLDSGSPHSCSSPKSYKNLSKGTHAFQVEATDVHGRNGRRTKATFHIG